MSASPFAMLLMPASISDKEAARERQKQRNRDATRIRSRELRAQRAADRAQQTNPASPRAESCGNQP